MSIMEDTEFTVPRTMRKKGWEGYKQKESEKGED